jgi:hypothetical protein
VERLSASVSLAACVGGLGTLHGVVQSLVRNELVKEWEAHAGGGAAREQPSAAELRHAPKFKHNHNLNLDMTNFQGTP